MTTETAVRPVPAGSASGSHPLEYRRILPGGGRVLETTVDDVTDVRLTGEIDAFDRYALCDVLTGAALRDHVRIVRVVLDDVPFLDVQILRLLATVRSRIDRMRCTLVVTGLRGPAARAWALLVEPGSSGLAAPVA